MPSKREEFLLPFKEKDVRYTFNQKLELVTNLINTTINTNELIKYYTERIKLLYEARHYKRVLKDIDLLEVYTVLNKSMAIIKWTSGFYSYSSKARKDIIKFMNENADDDKDYDGDNDEMIHFLNCISQSNIDKLLQNKNKKRQGNVKRLQ